MLASARFWLYRNIIALFMFLAFRSQKVVPLEAPVDGPVQFEPYADAHRGMPVKGLWMATTFPAGDHAEKRLRRIKGQTKLLGLVKRIAPRQTPPVSSDERRFAAAIYPRFFRKAWPGAPTLAPELSDTDDLLAELAVRGPYASYLRRGDDGAYVVDVDWITAYDVAPGLARPGGTAVFTVRDGRLVTETVGLVGVTPEHARAAYLAALNEDLTTFRHNVSVHLAMLTSFALASTNHLEATHPVRRLLHHCFNTVLIGHVELSSAQLSGPQGFAATIFSHEADEVLPYGPGPPGPVRLLGLRARHAVRAPGHRRDSVPLPLPRQRHASVGADARTSRTTSGSTTTATRTSRKTPNSRRGPPSSTG